MNAEESSKAAQPYKIDPLSQILTQLKLEASIYHNAKICGNWRVTEHCLGATCFHMVTMGSCLLNVPGHFDGVLNFGDLVIFPRELPHSMTPEKPLTGKQRHLDYQAAELIEGTGMLCGQMRFPHHSARYLLDGLPPLMFFRHAESNSWMRSLAELIVAESVRCGSASKAILDRLSELLFSYALRQYLIDHPSESGLLALYSHPQLAPAVNSMHAHPDHDWTLKSLAEQAALSRTSFAHVFKSVSGWTAGQYLLWWRMQMAWSLLSEGACVAAVAEKVGYKSESAFSRAFQTTFSAAPGGVRRRNPVPA
jgi:AraC-like DNA-binding protein